MNERQTPNENQHPRPFSPEEAQQRLSGAAGWLRNILDQYGVNEKYDHVAKVGATTEEK